MIPRLLRLRQYRFAEAQNAAARLRGGAAAVPMDRTVPFLRALPPALALYPGHGRCGMSLGEGLGSMDW